MRQALVDRTVTRSTIRADVGVAIVPQTISRHLAEANFKSKRPFHWQKVVFRDELRFVLGTDDNRVRVWRRPGEQCNLPHTVLRHTARTAGVMVWVAIAYDSRSTLIVMRGTLTGQRFVEDILLPHVGPFLNGLPGAHFSSKIRLIRIQQEFLKTSYVIFRLSHVRSGSPDLSHVVHVWDQLKRQMPSCHSVHDLELAVQDLWAHLPQDNIRCLISSMPDRVVACIAAGGRPTRY
ncbi:transposable element Tcb2 transposase [Trichonephila clavipes]|nr:transposable element Tcb2 transposase [Trichonephila clavipes]